MIMITTTGVFTYIKQYKMNGQTPPLSRSCCWKEKKARGEAEARHPQFYSTTKSIKSC